MQKHANISIFVPHLGCPNMCSFCNQRYITETSEIPNEQTIEKAVEIAKNSKGYSPDNTEIAFFGGSFTAIDFDFMVSLLKKAHYYVQNKTVSGIRISTRPDAINSNILNTLKQYSVTTVELGAQSMDNKVLLAANRGHSKEHVINASALIKDYGFNLGLQMMTGLPESTAEKDILTANEFIKLKPNQVRIYPTIVLKDTELEQLYLKGEYTPQSVCEAADLCVELLDIFNKANIPVIRLGLHTIDLTKYVAGPWHPAFREICESKILFNKMLGELSIFEKGSYSVFVNPLDVSKAIGQKRENINKLKNIGFNVKVVADDTISKNTVKIGRCQNAVKVY